MMSRRTARRPFGELPSVALAAYAMSPNAAVLVVAPQRACPGGLRAGRADR